MTASHFSDILFKIIACSVYQKPLTFRFSVISCLCGLGFLSRGKNKNPPFLRLKSGSNMEIGARVANDLNSAECSASEAHRPLSHGVIP